MIAKAARRSSRELGGCPEGETASARAIIRYFGCYHGGPIELPQEPRSEELTGMGPLVWLEVQTFYGRFEEWTFDPMPRLAYDTRQQLWPVGGDFRFGARGFRNTKYGTTPLTQEDVDRIRGKGQFATMVDRFRRDHGGRAPTEAVSGYAGIPKHPIALALLHALAYRNDKGDGNGRVNWRHSFLEDRRLPVLATSPEGDSLAFLGGAYSISQGWIT